MRFHETRKALEKARLCIKRPLKIQPACKLARQFQNGAYFQGESVVGRQPGEAYSAKSRVAIVAIESRVRPISGRQSGSRPEDGEVDKEEEEDAR